ncbi:N-acetylmuramoyl-L-alanine amidase [Campylobacter sp. VicNov18]|uniref:N-acetylmuramoyl-L-alanine amidase family protein n=1 Tax=Campylobacter bilis TaxID=2691918 RepID=UPI00130EC5E2|nr:N-acetylmuramoyl-L-alanine amidase [Campylobacter bilis]MPV63115.1 N-acetylmuramoyl-L-alanine amidase [Campylobacter hepaticus]MBM0636614.1 N-acetylmuramoyl-L-alanine amidase [Campylobacter bilis]MCC8277459.1 N-acetylmuramoyl-L-alanine amidase [Campylobacter bilis]MCC8298664.1 N-acetylmuramoyl-L-alanine amidase [Campylobacter bilis]MCC8300368.1 N-acetylmuramoyl-L-alanine amidase [Campylobacter bilis]
MAKIFTFLVFFFTFLLGAYESELANFDKNFIVSKSESQLQFHRQLKILYIQSVINEDEKAKIEILKRLIISSKSLNLDDKSYASELKESGISEASIDALRKVVLKDVKAQNTQKSNLQTSNTVQTSQKKENNKTNQKDNIFEDNTLIYVLKSKKIHQGIELELNRNLDKDKLKSFALNQKGNYRFISDFDGILKGSKQEFQFEDCRLVISQFNPKTIRIVFYAKEKIPINITFKEEKLIFSKESIIEQASKENKSILNKKQVEKTESKAKVLPTQKQVKKDNQKSLYVLSVDKISNAVRLNLSNDLDEKDITVLNIKEKNFFRYAISFKAVLKGNKQSFVFGQNAITIAQYNPNTVRVVLSAPKEFKFLKNQDSKSLVLGFDTQINNKKTHQSLNKNSNKSLNTNYKSGKIVVIDAGHGGKDSGALSDKKGDLKEKDIVLSVALKLGLELQKRGYKPLYTRSLDKFINLRDRTKYANDKRADLFISIHANAAPNAKKIKSSEGVETFFLSPARSERSKKAAEKENQGDFEEINYFSKQSILNFLNREKIVASNKLAIDVQKNILTQTRKKYKIVDGGVREAPFWVLVGAQMPAILIEIGYITHPNEGKRIASKAFQDLLVKGIADGVESYFYNNR